SAGDAVLQTVSDILSQNVRSSDVVGRLGGDEFAVLLVNADETLARKKAESLADAIRCSRTMWNDRTLKVSASFGIYAFSGAEDPNSVLAAADRAMYADKSVRRSGDK